MIPFRRIYLDTNIFIFAVEGSDRISALISEILVKAEGQPGLLVTSEISLAELLVKPLRVRDITLAKEFENVLLASGGIELITIPRMAYRYAAALRSHRPSIKLPDALHLAAAVACGATHFMTLDEGLSPPFDLSNLGAMYDIPPIDLTILRPDIPTLETLLQSLNT